MFKRKTPFVHPTLAETLGNEFTELELAALSSLGTIVDMPAYEVFATEGSIGQEAVVVLSGTAHVMRDGEDVASVGPGAILGERSLLTNEPRNASLMTMSDTKLVVLNRREFASLLDQFPRLATVVDELVTERVA